MQFLLFALLINQARVIGGGASFEHIRYEPMQAKPLLRVLIHVPFTLKQDDCAFTSIAIYGSQSKRHIELIEN